jgi:TRAP-type C4-dicarboxylate transport system permease large subunit
MAIYFLLGMVMSSVAMVILTIPIFFPIMMDLGFDPIWFGIIVVKVTEIAMITPPVGINVFIMKGIARDVPMYSIFRGITPFLIAEVLNVTLLLFVPQITTLIPSMMR